MPFDFQGTEVRTITDADGNPWFVAKDVCAVLGIKNSSDALSSLDADEKGVATTDTLGGPQQVATVDESGLYALVFRSRKPEAQRFRKWVTREVLPEIRRTGTYAAQGAHPLPCHIVPALACIRPEPDAWAVALDAVDRLSLHMREQDTYMRSMREVYSVTHGDMTAALEELREMYAHGEMYRAQVRALIVRRCGIAAIR